jgi:pimeloyl-ACP methyl ester carboxylesterase
MKPMFFGDSSRKLYGVYDAPSGSTRRSHAVLLCYPGVQEYGTSHWAFRRLAAMLARDGHHVMRFDYFGTGDSSGDVQDGSSEVWIQDIQQAALELKDLSGARHLSLLGKRLGGTLGAKACSMGLELQRLVLWDPVVSGQAYVEELETWDARRNLLLLHAERRRAGRSELLGYPFPARQREDLSQLSLFRERPTAAKKVGIFASDSRSVYSSLLDSYRTAGLYCELKLASDALGGPGQTEAQDRAQLSGSILNDMASELGAEVQAA